MKTATMLKSNLKLTPYLYLMLFIFGCFVVSAQQQQQQQQQIQQQQQQQQQIQGPPIQQQQQQQVSPPPLIPPQPAKRCPITILPHIYSYRTGIRLDSESVGLFCATAARVFGLATPYFGTDDQTIFIACLPRAEVLTCEYGRSSACFPGFPCPRPCTARAEMKALFPENYVAFAITTISVTSTITQPYTHVISSASWYDFIKGEERIDIGLERFITQRTPTGIAVKNGYRFFDDHGAKHDIYTEPRFSGAFFPRSGIPQTSILVGFGQGVAHWEINTGGLFSAQPPAKIQITTTLPYFRGDELIVTPLKIVKEYQYGAFQKVKEITDIVQFDSLDFIPQGPTKKNEGGFFPTYQFKLSDWKI